MDHGALPLLEDCHCNVIVPEPVAALLKLSATGSSPVQRFCTPAILPGETLFTVMVTIFDVSGQFTLLEAKVVIRR